VIWYCEGLGRALHCLQALQTVHDAPPQRHSDRGKVAAAEAQERMKRKAWLLPLHLPPHTI